MSESDSTSRPASASLLESKVSLPYPSFSKAHSKEAVGSRESLGPRLNVLTPEPTATDLDGERTKDSRRGSADKGTPDHKRQSRRKQQNTNSRPLSPPLTNDDPDCIGRKDTSSEGRASEEKEKSTKAPDEAKKTRTRPHSTRSSSSVQRKSSEQTLKAGKTARPSTPKLKLFDVLQFPHKPSPQSKVRSSEKTSSSRRSSQQKKSPSPPRSSVSDNTITNAVDSDATSIAPIQVQTTTNLSKDSRGHRKARSLHSRTRSTDNFSGRKRNIHENAGAAQSPTTPPPPPPPPEIPLTRPKVDYLLQNGGLGYPVPRNFLGAGESTNMPQCMFDPNIVGSKLFEPFSRLLDDYGDVMQKNGSLAVATGYRSVARRLLDRLEAVFARDISSEICECHMCYTVEPNEELIGVSWGEVLEIVSGRRELPSWPPFHINAEPGAEDLGKSKRHTPMQKLDIDVPEEFREHYIRQSQKTKHTVNKWLSRQPDQSSTLPEEVDDETLAFAIVTSLDKTQRGLYYQLMEIRAATPVPRKETPKPPERPASLIIPGAAIQRLYRLSIPPRDPETALFLVKNPGMHNVLATVAAINEDEWDILISGRFDGFLRSGAEDDLPPTSSTAPPRKNGAPVADGPLRPASQPHGSASGRRKGTSSQQNISASAGGPISIDEESEIAVLSEVERDIFLGMEALEDAFEMLHSKAETVRRILRERNAGLTAANQARRGNIQVLPGAPPLGGRWSNSATPFEAESDDGIDDMLSEIAPSDSASNISSNRRRRPKRRTERRTPAPVEEEEDEG